MFFLELVTHPLTSWIGSDMPQEELFNITCTARRGYRCVDILVYWKWYSISIERGYVGGFPLFNLVKS